MKLLLESAEGENSSLRVVRVDIDESDDVVASAKIRSLPCTHIYKGVDLVLTYSNTNPMQAQD